MMRAAKVFYKGREAGILQQNDDGSFVFEYLKAWLVDSQNPSISLTLPKKHQKFWSSKMFPFFYHLLPEGANKRTICQIFKMDESDAFGILLNVANVDTIGAVTLKKITK